MQLKRRTLLSGLAASAAVPFMSAAHAKQADADTKWDKETDVLNRLRRSRCLRCN